MLSPKNAAKILFVVFLGILAMHLRLRLSLVDPTNFEWLWNGDWANAASGFLFFVEDAWRWPVGKMENLLAPLGTSIGFTDSIPLAAFFFKAIRELLPFPFHYLGLWFLLCFILQALFSFLIFEELKLKTWIAFGGAFLVALAPPLLYRIGHISLCSHFFILWQILMYFKFRHQNHPKFLLGAGAGVLLATGIHPYIWAMVFLMSLALELEMLRGKRDKRSIFLATASLGLKFSSSFAALKAVGYFLPADKDHGGFSFYKGDLTVFLNPMGEKTFLPRISASAGQYESYAYLGLGSILILAYCLITQAGRSFLKSCFMKLWPLAFVCVASWIYSLSNEVSFAGKVLFDGSFFYKVLGPLPNMFRSAGRFAWPLFYVMFIALWAFAGRSFSRKNAWIVALVFVVQILDLKVFYDNLPPRESRVELPFEQDFEASQKKHVWKKLVAIPQAGWGICAGRGLLDIEQRKSLIYFAALKRLQTNMGDVSRFPKSQLEQECLLSQNEIRQDSPNSENLYIIHRSEWSAYPLAKLKKFRCVERGDYQMCFANLAIQSF